MSMPAAAEDAGLPQPRVQGGPAAWRGADLATRDDWIYRLSANDIAELEAALAAVRARDLQIERIGRADFPLPTLGPKLTALRAEVIDGRGFVLIRGLPIADRARLDVFTLYWGIGAHVGRALPQNGKGHLLGHVRDLGYDVNDTRVRVYQTRERQNYHTDSCDIVSLLCLNPAKKGGQSAIVSSVTVHDEMVRRRPDLAARLYRPFCADRRSEVPAGRKPYYRVPVFNLHDGLLSTSWVRRYIESAQRFPEVPRLAPEDIAAFDLLDALCDDPALHLEMAFQPGDMQFLNNYVILHDRTAYEDWPEPTRKRHLLRLWLCPEVGRTLPPTFADRIRSVEIGDRGGVAVPGAVPHVPLDPA